MEAPDEQRELLLGARGFTHTLLVDLDEIVMANPRLYRHLSDYVARGMGGGRAVAAPVGYEVQFSPALGDAPLDWDRPPLLAQRRAMVRVCGMNKPILSRVPSAFTFSTHNLLLHAGPSPARAEYGACGAHYDCVEPALALLHTKCLDEQLWADHPELADRDRAGKNASAAALRDYFRARCGDVERWARTPCALAPPQANATSRAAWLSEPARHADGDAPPACERVRLTFGIRKDVVPVEPIPPWLARLY